MANFFNTFPKIDYTYGDIKIANINDITIRIDIVKEVIDHQTNFEMYDVQEGDTPEIVAYNFYNDTSLHWVILLANDITSRSEWPLTTNELNKFIIKKYPAAEFAPHHFEATVDGVKYNSNTSTIFINNIMTAALPVSNREYETILNDDKKLLKLLKADAVTEVYAELKRLITNG